MFLPIPILIAVVWISIVAMRHHDDDSRASSLKRSAFVLMLVTGGFMALFVAGETLTDPGGWAGVGLVAAWAVPLAVAAFVGWRWPVQAGVLFAVLAAAVLAGTVWYAVDTDGWDDWEDRNGPIRFVISLAVAAALAFYAWRRPAVGGALILVVTLVPSLVTAGAHGAGAAAFAVVGSPLVLAGVLFLLSAYYGAGRKTISRRPRRGVTPSRGRPHPPAASL